MEARVERRNETEELTDRVPRELRGNTAVENWPRRKSSDDVGREKLATGVSRMEEWFVRGESAGQGRGS